VKREIRKRAEIYVRDLMNGTVKMEDQMKIGSMMNCMLTEILVNASFIQSYRGMIDKLVDKITEEREPGTLDPE